MDYKKAGVDILGSTRVKQEIARLAATTYNKNVLGGIGHFGAMYDLGKGEVLVTSVDGVGTKLGIAQKMGDCQVIGADLVNHGVNDISCLGAAPLFFLDYLGQEKLNQRETLQIIQGMVSACQEARIPLIGGESAQLPDVYLKGKAEAVGFIAGIVSKEKIIDGSKIKAGDKIIGLPSLGLHTNGYSLVRKIFSDSEKFNWLPNHFWHLRVDELGESLGQALLKPHKSYLKSLSLLFSKPVDIHGIAHITGGGIAGNVVRILPDGCQARIRLGTWPALPIFQYIQKEGGLSDEEMYRVFNMGIGMVLIVSRETSGMVSHFLWNSLQPRYTIGEVIKGKKGVKIETH